LEKEGKEQPRQASTSKIDQDELAEKRARPPKSSLAVLLSRLSLDYRQELEETLVICLTHYSFKGSSKNIKHNESLASLGNHLLGLFTAEHLSRKFPLMPTEVLKGAVTAYVGPLACQSIARELGVTATSNTGEATALIPVRWANPKHSKRNTGSGLVQS
jgi:large subunit ribosomal protein L44